MTEFRVGSFSTTLAILAQKGLSFATVIDLGCADGHFYLQHFEVGVLPGSTCVNVDANAIYEASLKEIQQVLGGHYAIAAISDSDGEIELRTGSHPYWASLLPPEHPYWAGSHNQPGATIKVRALTLDTLVQQFALKPPFLLKLDLQCGELAALRGGVKMLKETDTVICETGNDEFPSVCEFLSNHNFGLIDLTEISRMPDGFLCQLYPVFLNRRLDHIRSTLPWDPSNNQDMIVGLDQRRKNILNENAMILAKYRS